MPGSQVGPPVAPRFQSAPADNQVLQNRRKGGFFSRFSVIFRPSRGSANTTNSRRNDSLSPGSVNSMNSRNTQLLKPARYMPNGIIRLANAEEIRNLHAEFVTGQGYNKQQALPLSKKDADALNDEIYTASGNAIDAKNKSFERGFSPLGAIKPVFTVPFTALKLVAGASFQAVKFAGVGSFKAANLVATGLFRGMTVGFHLCRPNVNALAIHDAADLGLSKKFRNKGKDEIVNELIRLETEGENGRDIWSIARSGVDQYLHKHAKKVTDHKLNGIASEDDCIKRVVSYILETIKIAPGVMNAKQARAEAVDNVTHTPVANEVEFPIAVEVPQ